MSSLRVRGPWGFFERFGLRALVAAAGVLLAAIVLAVLVVVARSRTGPIHDFDFHTDARLNHYAAAHRGQLGFWRAVTTVGDPTTLRIVAAVLALALLLRRKFRPVALIVVGMAGAAILSEVTKLAVGRARPVVKVPVAHVGGRSFPSGHALNSLVACGILLILLLPQISRLWRLMVTVLAVAFVAAVGFSRLILGVHYPTDVLGGWLIGSLWLATLLLILDRTPGFRRPARPWA